MILVCGVCRTQYGEVSPLDLKQVIFEACDSCQPGADPIKKFLRQAQNELISWENRSAWFEANGHEGLAHFGWATVSCLKNVVSSLVWEVEKKEKVSQWGKP